MHIIPDTASLLIHSIPPDTQYPCWTPCWYQPWNTSSLLIHIIRANTYHPCWYILSMLIHNIPADYQYLFWYKLSLLIHNIHAKNPQHPYSNSKHPCRQPTASLSSRNSPAASIIHGTTQHPQFLIWWHHPSVTRHHLTLATTKGLTTAAQPTSRKREIVRTPRQMEYTWEKQ
jgi:hypothetical protein